MIVYYSNTTNSFVYEPEPLFQSLFSNLKTNGKDSVQLDQIKKCPSVKEFCNNTFVFKNAIEYDLEWVDGLIKTSSKNQKFFDTNVIVRDANIGLCSYKFPSDIFLAEKPLIGELTPPFLHDCDISKKATMVCGSFDMGRHFRSLECAFIFKNKNDRIQFRESQPLYYVRFRTDDKIKFQKFIWTEEMQSVWINMIQMREGVKPLQFWYNIFEKSYRKHFLRLIKQNLV